MQLHPFELRYSVVGQEPLWHRTLLHQSASFLPHPMSYMLCLNWNLFPFIRISIPPRRFPPFGFPLCSQYFSFSGSTIVDARVLSPFHFGQIFCRTSSGTHTFSLITSTKPSTSSTSALPCDSLSAFTVIPKIYALSTSFENRYLSPSRVRLRETELEPYRPIILFKLIPLEIIARNLALAVSSTTDSSGGLNPRQRYRVK